MNSLKLYERTDLELEVVRLIEYLIKYKARSVRKVIAGDLYISVIYN